LQRVWQMPLVARSSKQIGRRFWPPPENNAQLSFEQSRGVIFLSAAYFAD
jgi:hypothetical protein